MGTWHDDLVALVADRLGIDLGHGVLADSVDRFVLRRSHALALRPEQVVERLVADPREFEPLTALVAVGFTYFLRGREQLEEAADHAARRSAPRVWVAACSTGQEAWSLAMLLAERGSVPRVVATDLVAGSLAAARAARYSDWDLRGVPLALRDRYFHRRDGAWQIADALRRVVSFHPHNLVRDPAPERHVDVVTCRNTFIYFGGTARRRALATLEGALAPEGRLFLGPGEASPLPPADLPAPRACPPALASPSLPPTQLPRGFGPAEDAIAWVTRGNRALATHTFDTAREAYARAEGLNPLLPELHYFVGVLCRKQGDLEAGARALRRALFLDPDCWPAASLLAGIEGRLGRRPEQQRLLQEARRALAERGAEPGFLAVIPEELRPDPRALA